jgi:hypothetical protein
LQARRAELQAKEDEKVEKEAGNDATAAQGDDDISKAIRRHSRERMEARKSGGRTPRYAGEGRKVFVRLFVSISLCFTELQLYSREA